MRNLNRKAEINYTCKSAFLINYTARGKQPLKAKGPHTDSACGYPVRGSSHLLSLTVKCNHFTDVKLALISVISKCTDPPGLRRCTINL